MTQENVRSQRIVKAIWEDLSGRSGFGNTIDEIDGETAREIERAWLRLIDGVDKRMTFRERELGLRYRWSKLQNEKMEHSKSVPGPPYPPRAIDDRPQG